MPETIKLQEARDRKEGSLDAVKNAVTAQEQGFKFSEKLFKERLEQYQMWKKIHGIEGIKY